MFGGVSAKDGIKGELVLSEVGFGNVLIQLDFVSEPFGDF